MVPSLVTSPLSPFASPPPSTNPCRCQRIPFYAYIRLLFHLYLVLPQTQGARILYQSHLQPYLHDNERGIEDFIASAHHRLRQAGISYLKRAIELLRTNVLGLPPSPPSAAAASSSSVGGEGQSYTQTLLARFSLPGARWGAAGAAGQGSAADFYNLLASAVGAASASSAATTGSAPGVLVPDDIRGASARMSFIAAQRERLAALMSALDREASQIQEGEEEGGGGAPLSKSRSEADFEKLEAESGEEEGEELRRRTPGLGGQAAGWVSWAWGGGGGGGGKASPAAAGGDDGDGEGTSTGVEK